MGASDFYHRSKGTTPKEAFNKAVADAQYQYGHGGYTGTIAEKNNFIVLPVPEGMSPKEYAEHLMLKDDKRISDKWGPAGCVKLNDGEWLFFGWASD